MCGDFETCFGKGIARTGCAKMVMGPDIFQQYLVLFNSKKTEHPLRKCERRIDSGLETTRPDCHSGQRSFQ